MRYRTDFTPKVKKEIAHGFYTGTLSEKEIERKGIKINNVYRWMKEIYGPGGRQRARAGGGGGAHARSSPPPESSAATSTTATETPPAIETTAPELPPAPAAGQENAAAPPLDINSLSKKDLKRDASGRYDPRVKDAIVAALLHMSVTEVSRKTGLTPATLYIWKNGAKTPSKTAAIRDRGNGTAVVPVAPKAVAVRKAELLFQQGAVDAQFANIRKAEGFTNIDKAIKELKAAYRSGAIEDYDPIDLRILLGYSQLIGAPLRSRK